MQGYAYAAYHGAALLARCLDRAAMAADCDAKAAALARRFDPAFWLDELGTYALALDGAKRPCRVRASNAGQVLFCGLASQERAERVASTLMAPDSFSDWGVRTIASGEARYNPMSYHNGSIWPAPRRLTTASSPWASATSAWLEAVAAAAAEDGLFDAMLFNEIKGVPELFLRLRARRKGMGPTSYPVACMTAPAGPPPRSSRSPRRSARASPSMFAGSRVLFTAPRLCRTRIDELRLTTLRLGDGSADVVLRRSRDAAALYVTRREGPIESVLVA